MMEERFGDKKHVGSALMQFFALHQEDDEPIEAWAARIREIARQAFPEHNPTSYETQVTVKFSMGLANKDAARYVCSQNPKTIREAVQAFHIFTYADDAATRTSWRQNSTNDTFSVFAVNKTPTHPVKKENPVQTAFAEPVLDKSMTSILDQINTQMTQMSRKLDKQDKYSKETKDTLQNLDERLKTLEVDVSSFKRDKSKSVSFKDNRRSSPSRKGACFNCGEADHWSRECPKARNSRQVAAETEATVRHDDLLSCDDSD